MLKSKEVMNWIEVLGIILGSSAATELVSFLFRKKQVDANIYDKFTRRLEDRIGVLERRIDKMELRDSIFSSATACAYACRYTEECPVIRHLINNPLPEKTTEHEHGPEHYGPEHHGGDFED